MLATAVRGTQSKINSTINSKRIIICFSRSFSVCACVCHNINVFIRYSTWYAEHNQRVVTRYVGSGLKAQNMTGIRAQRKGLRAQKGGIRDHKAFELESGIRFITP